MLPALLKIIAKEDTLMKKLIIAILVIFVFAMLFAGCSDNNNVPGSPDPYMPTTTTWPTTTQMPNDTNVLPGGNLPTVSPGGNLPTVSPGGNLPTVSPNTNNNY